MRSAASQRGAVFSLAAILCVAAQVAPVAHAALVPHGRCAAHGELIELEPAPHARAARSAPLSFTAAEPPAPHQHCSVVVFREVTPALVRGMPPRWTALPTRVAAPGLAPVARLSPLVTAPKGSPPA